MDAFRIFGPQRLQGRVRASGAKNAALPALAASLLSSGQTVQLQRVPEVRDVRTMRHLLAHLGVESEWQGSGTLNLAATGTASPDDAPYDLVKTMRASVLVLGPLLARRGHARVSLPGGCAIGVRPIDQHLQALSALGADITLSHGYVTASASRLQGARFRFATPTVTGTENALMAASLARGETILQNSAKEPEIRSLAALLNAMGARIEGAGSEEISIQGVDELGEANHEIIPDRIEGGTYLIAAALTAGDVILEKACPEDLAALLEKLTECGASVEVGENSVRVSAQGDLRARDVVTSPHPGFPTDLQAQYVALMTQAQGQATVCETIFENRFQHIAELQRMGARIELDGSFARIYGPSPLSGAKVMATDLRASACLVLAALAARGETRISRIYHLDRGYEAMGAKLTGLGAQVERVSDS